MGRFTEDIATQLAIKIIGDNPWCSTEFLIEQIENNYTFSPEDLEPLANRNDYKYSQIIRNLTSHYNSNKFGRSVDRRKSSDNRTWEYCLKQQSLNAHNINKTKNIIDEIDDYENDIEVINTNDGYKTEKEVDDSSNRMPTLKEGTNKNHRFKTDPKLAKRVLEVRGRKCELEGIINDRTHKTFKTKRTENYTEAHHLIPMKAQKDFPGKNLDRIENIISLCPTCHRAVHYGTHKEKEKYLKPLYDTHIKLLRECKHHIDIDFDDLLNKYY